MSVAAAAAFDDSETLVSILKGKKGMALVLVLVLVLVVLVVVVDGEADPLKVSRLISTMI